MKFLIDTHTFIWYVTNNSKLSSVAQKLIDDGNNDVLLSIASVWEMGIKHSIGKLTFELPFMTFVTLQMQQNSMEILNIRIEHLDVVANLPLHHRDPFDRLIISQTMVEQLPIVGVDKAFDSYAVRRLW